MTEQPGLGSARDVSGELEAIPANQIDPGPVPPEIFYDAIKYWLIPDMAKAALYFDGMYACPRGEATRLQAVRWITIGADYRHCGIADYEPGNPVYEVPGLLREFVAGRLGMRRRARVYTDLDNLHRARVDLADLPYELWIATLDGDRLTPDYAPNLWAVQFEGGPNGRFDRSVLYGDW